MKISDEMIRAFGQAWHTADDMGHIGEGARRRAGLEAALAAYERERATEKRSYMAVADVNGYNGSGTVRTPVSFAGPVTAELIGQIEASIKNNSRGTQIPSDASVTIINLIPLGV